MGIIAGILAVGLNRVLCSILLAMEKRLATKGAIPQRGEVLYLEDYSFFVWGDRIFVTVLDFCIVVVLMTAHLSWITALAAVVLGTAWTLYCHTQVWLPRTKGFDSCYPQAGHVSPLGRVHLVYFWFQWTLGLLGLWEVAQMAFRLVGLSFGRPLDWYTSLVALLGLVAAGAYFWTLFVIDVRAGRFPSH